MYGLLGSTVLPLHTIWPAIVAVGKQLTSIGTGTTGFMYTECTGATQMDTDGIDDSASVTIMGMDSTPFSKPVTALQTYEARPAELTPLSPFTFNMLFVKERAPDNYVIGLPDPVAGTPVSGQQFLATDIYARTMLIMLCLQACPRRSPRYTRFRRITPRA